MVDKTPNSYFVYQYINAKCCYLRLMCDQLVGEAPILAQLAFE